MGKKQHRRFDQHEHRRDQFTRPQAPAGRVSWTWVVIAAGLGFIVLTLYTSTGTNRAGMAAARADVQILPAGQDVRLPVSLFSDGKARFYRYTTSIGREIQLFVMKSADGVIRAAFDACDVCYRARKGYGQSGDHMICNNCGRAFRSVDVNVIQGGCNPAPIDRTVDGGDVVLKARDLGLGAGYF